MAGAYRQVPLTAGQVKTSATVVYNGDSDRVALFEIYGQPFGAAHAVPNFVKVVEWVCRLMVRVFNVLVNPL